jgi:hypothetical protein
MRKFLLAFLTGVLLLAAIGGIYWQRRATEDRTPVSDPATAQESDCATPPPPEEKPPAPAGLAMGEPCGEGGKPGSAAPVR